MTDYAFLRTGSGLTVHFDSGDSFTWTPDHPSYEQATDLIKGGASAADLEAIMDVKKKLSAVTATYGDFTVSDDGVTYKGKLLNLGLTQRIIAMAAEGFPITAMLRFLERLLKNPRREAIQSLYDFMEHNKLPLNADGTFVAYKIVRKDYKDIYSGTFDNSVGKTCEMEPWEVEADRDQTCSAGLHVCSKDYLPHYGSGGSRIMIVRVCPSSVVAVPRDYNNAKMRVWKYEVVGEMDSKASADILEKYGVLTPDRREAVSSNFTWGDNVADSDDEPEEDDDSDLGEVEQEDESLDNGNISALLHTYDDDHVYTTEIGGVQTAISAAQAEALVKGFEDVYVSHRGTTERTLIENDLDV